MKLLVATSYYRITSVLQEQLAATDIQAELTLVETVDDLVKELTTDNHDFIITEYSIEETDVWELAKLVNSMPLAAHSLPIYLIKDTLETDIPVILAKAHSFTVVSFEEIGSALKKDQAHNLRTGYVRGRKPIDKPTLLIIEDDEDAATSTRHALKDNYDIDIAYTGETGLELWESKRHELVLLDYMLPGIKGNEVLEKMMDIDKNQPVIIITAFDRPERNKNMILNGASEYLCKPFALSDLRTQCQTILNRARLIYQDHYKDTKTETLRNLLWLLNHALAHDEFEKAKRVASAIKLLISGNPTDDEQINLLKLEF